MSVDQAYRELDAEEAAGHAAYLAAGGAFAAGGADNVPAIPPLPPVEPKADDIVVHLATRRIQAGYEFGSAA